MQLQAVEALQPGHLAWLQATGRERQHAESKPRGQQKAAAAPACAPATPATRSADALPRPTQRAGSEARYVRRWLQPRMPDLCEAVLRSALGGDMEATRLLLRMGGLDGKAEVEKKKKPTKTGPGFAKKAIDEFRAR